MANFKFSTLAPETLILTRRDVASLMDQAAWLEAVETGFRAAAEGKAQAPPPMTIHGQGGAFHAKGASLALDRHYVALKLNGNFPDNPAMRGLPTIQGALLLCDGETAPCLRSWTRSKSPCGGPPPPPRLRPASSRARSRNRF
jgi:ornithine cyclodeaminase/alanine dehydrogenase-like protein (mu-crystallin family)